MIHLALVLVLGLPTPSGYSVTSTNGSWSVLTNSSSQNLIGWTNANSEWVAFQQPTPPPSDPEPPPPPDGNGDPVLGPPTDPAPGPALPAIIPTDPEFQPDVYVYSYVTDDAVQVTLYYSYATINGVDCTIIWTDQTNYLAYQIMSGNWSPL